LRSQLDFKHLLSNLDSQGYGLISSIRTVLKVVEIFNIYIKKTALKHQNDAINAVSAIIIIAINFFSGFLL
jgi:hypothetical protein